MKKNKKVLKINDETKKLVVALTEKIKQERQKELGDGFQRDGELFKTTFKFNAKTMTKSQYSQLFALYTFMEENPNVTEDEIRKVLHSKSINFWFLNKCDANIEDFISELRKHGPVSMALKVENRNKGLEN